MKKYIDAEKLKTEITRLKGQLIHGACASQIAMKTNCKDEAYNEVLAIITSLQQEQPEVNLEAEINAWYNTMGIPVSSDALKETVRHFYERGYERGSNARKEK